MNRERLKTTTSQLTTQPPGAIEDIRYVIKPDYVVTPGQGDDNVDPGLLTRRKFLQTGTLAALTLPDTLNMVSWNTAGKLAEAVGLLFPATAEDIELNEYMRLDENGYGLWVKTKLPEGKPNEPAKAVTKQVFKDAQERIAQILGFEPSTEIQFFGLTPTTFNHPASFRMMNHSQLYSTQALNDHYLPLLRLHSNIVSGKYVDTFIPWVNVLEIASQVRFFPEKDKIVSSLQDTRDRKLASFRKKIEYLKEVYNYYADLQKPIGLTGGIDAPINAYTRATQSTFTNPNLDDDTNYLWELATLPSIRTPNDRFRAAVVDQLRGNELLFLPPQVLGKVISIEFDHRKKGTPHKVNDNIVKMMENVPEPIKLQSLFIAAYEQANHCLQEKISPPTDAVEFFDFLDHTTAAKIFSALSPNLQKYLLPHLSSRKLALWLEAVMPESKVADTRAISAEPGLIPLNIDPIANLDAEFLLQSFSESASPAKIWEILTQIPIKRESKILYALTKLKDKNVADIFQAVLDLNSAFPEFKKALQTIGKEKIAEYLFNMDIRGYTAVNRLVWRLVNQKNPAELGWWNETFGFPKEPFTSEQRAIFDGYVLFMKKMLDLSKQNFDTYKLTGNNRQKDLAVEYSQKATNYWLDIYRNSGNTLAAAILVDGLNNTDATQLLAPLEKLSDFPDINLRHIIAILIAYRFTQPTARAEQTNLGSMLINILNQSKEMLFFSILSDNPPSTIKDVLYNLVGTGRQRQIDEFVLNSLIPDSSSGPLVLTNLDGNLRVVASSKSADGEENKIDLPNYPLEMLLREHAGNIFAHVTAIDAQGTWVYLDLPEKTILKPPEFLGDWIPYSLTEPLFLKPEIINRQREIMAGRHYFKIRFEDSDLAKLPGFASFFNMAVVENDEIESIPPALGALFSIFMVRQTKPGLDRKSYLSLNKDLDITALDGKKITLNRLRDSVIFRKYITNPTGMATVIIEVPNIRNDQPLATEMQKEDAQGSVYYQLPADKFFSSISASNTPYSFADIATILVIELAYQKGIIQAIWKRREEIATVTSGTLVATAKGLYEGSRLGVRVVRAGIRDTKQGIRKFRDNWNRSAPQRERLIREIKEEIEKKGKEISKQTTEFVNKKAKELEKIADSELFMQFMKYLEFLRKSQGFMGYVQPANSDQRQAENEYLHAEELAALLEKNHISFYPFVQSENTT